ncbi:hypothetical protein HYW21_05605 [Candidatus Woesearchaeota archaeon]|nr:hypothetical protein [Candidatus Woesearchaeota archaeon]
MMTTIEVHKIASPTKNIPLEKQVTLTADIVAQEGQVVVVRALEEKRIYDQMELVTGRMAKISKNDIIVSVLGERKALKGFVGHIPETVVVGDVLHVLNMGGVIGLCTSENKSIGHALKVEVLGGVLIDGKPCNMKDFALPLQETLTTSVPLIMVAGTCMNTGKTQAACEIIQYLHSKQYIVAGAKVTGVSLMRDLLNMEDHGAVKALSFTDVGFPSTTNAAVVPKAAKGIIQALHAYNPDFIVVELGDGIMGDYGVQEILADNDLVQHVCCLVMAASDPVAAWGAKKAMDLYGHTIDIMCGPTTDDEVGIAFVEKKLGLSAANAWSNPKKFSALVEKKLKAKHLKTEEHRIHCLGINHEQHINTCEVN